jgi:uncharacterized protein (TIGR03067 family)
MPRRLVLIFVGAALLGFAPAPFPRAERRQAGDLTDVAGTWAVTLWEHRGRRGRRTEELVHVRLTKERFDFIDKRSGNESEGYVIRLDVAAHPPAFTLRLGERAERVEMVGSYRLKKDELIMIFTESERVEERPTDFSGTSEYRVELRRIRRD